MKIIKVSTELEMSVHEFPSGTIREHNKALCELIGNGCDLVEHVMPKRLYTELKMPSSPVKEPGKCVSMLIDEEGRLKPNKANLIGSSLIRKYGWDSNVVRVRVRGEFPNQEDDVFIPLSLIEQCSSKLLELDDSAGMQFVSLGVDVARFGDDETIIYRNYHGHCKIVRNRRGQNLMATAGDGRFYFPVTFPFSCNG